MSNWMNAGRKTYDNSGILLERLAGGFIGITMGAMLCRGFPSAAPLVVLFGLLFGVMLSALALSRSRNANIKPS